MPSPEEITNWLRGELKGNYGEKVEVQYVDVDDVEIKQFPQAVELLNQRGYNLPLVLIGNEVIQSGFVGVAQITTELRQRGLVPQVTGR